MNAGCLHVSLGGADFQGGREEASCRAKRWTRACILAAYKHLKHLVARPMKLLETLNFKLRLRVLDEPFGQ